MGVDLEKFARDLAFEIQLGGDRFDKQDVDALLLGVSSEQLALFREDVKRIAIEDYAPPREVASPEENAAFVEKQLDGWLRDVITKEEIDAVFADHHKLFEMDGKVHAAYPYAVDSKRAITGKIADDFSGPAFWSKEFPLEVCGHPDIEAVTFIDFTDCTNAYILYHDGSSKMLGEGSREEFFSVVMAVDHRVKELESMKAKNGFELSNVYVLDRGMLSLMVNDLNRRMLVRRVGEQLPEGVGIETFVGDAHNKGSYLSLSGIMPDSLTVELRTAGKEVSSFSPNKGTGRDFEKFLREGSKLMYSKENVALVREDLNRFRREVLHQGAGLKLN